MLKKTLTGCIMAALLIASSAAAAKVAPQETAGYVQKKTMIFKGTDIAGSVVGPKGGWVQGYEKVVFKSLIDYRMDFTPELSRAGESL